MPPLEAARRSTERGAIAETRRSIFAENIRDRRGERKSTNTIEYIISGDIYIPPVGWGASQGSQVCARRRPPAVVGK